MTKIEWRSYPRYRGLDYLTTIEWICDVCVASTPRVLFHMIRQNEFVAELRDRYLSGALTDDQIEAFVRRTAQDIRTGYNFDHTYAWVAILWIVRDSTRPFAKQFIDELAERNTTELYFVNKAAQEIKLRHR